MRRKKREISDICIELRKKKVKGRRDMEEKLGGKTHVYWRVLREVRLHNTVLREKLKVKNEKKINFLSMKYGKNGKVLKIGSRKKISKRPAIIVVSVYH